MSSPGAGESLRGSPVEAGFFWAGRLGNNGAVTDNDRQPLAKDEASAIPYSPGLRVGDTIYVSGAIGRPPGGELAADIAEQFRQLYRNIAVVLGEAGATWADVVEMTSYHIGLREHIETLFTVHREFVADPYPAWTAVGVTELLSKDAVLEIAVTAVRRQSR
jgi:enamine deaminase RidA (YjgF/YER057c/UK114 family)